jgi:2-amino-4-hydroxy-6-hydroxymethyldihydropteridine diphosphokinase
VGVRAEYRDLAFLNAVMVFDCTREPNEVSEIIHTIEADMGRVRGEDRFAPRPIDIDILYAGNTVSDCEDLLLPHPRWSQRRFVVEPLADVRPDLVLPGSSESVAQILAQLPEEPVVKLFTTIN